MGLFKPNKTAPLWAFLRATLVGNKTVRDMKQQTGQTNDNGRGWRQEAAMWDPMVAPAPSFNREPEDQMPDRSIVPQIDICTHEP